MNIVENGLIICYNKKVITKKEHFMKRFSKKASACIGNLLPGHINMATCVALGGGATV